MFGIGPDSGLTDNYSACFLLFFLFIGMDFEVLNLLKEPTQFAVLFELDNKLAMERYPNLPVF